MRIILQYRQVFSENLSNDMIGVIIHGSETVLVFRCRYGFSFFWRKCLGGGSWLGTDSGLLVYMIWEMFDLKAVHHDLTLSIKVIF